MTAIEKLIELMEENLKSFTRHDIDSDSYNRGFAYCLEQYIEEAQQLLTDEQPQKSTDIIAAKSFPNRK